MVSNNDVITTIIAIVGIPALYMAIVVPIGYLVGVDHIEGHTHYLYYVDVTLTRYEYLTGYIVIWFIRKCGHCQP